MCLLSKFSKLVADIANWSYKHVHDCRIKIGWEGEGYSSKWLIWLVCGEPLTKYGSGQSMDSPVPIHTLPSRYTCAYHIRM